MGREGRHREHVALMGLDFAHVTTRETIDHVLASIARGEGGLLLTANLDILRRFTRDAVARPFYERATLVVADGMPIVWASRLRGTPLPERVAGASLVPELAARAALEGRSLFLLGGEGDDARLAKEALEVACPGLRVVGAASPRVAFPPTPDDVVGLRALLAPAMPDVVLVAMGSPKQEAVAVALRPHLPSTWFVGVGASLAFVGGRMPRAPGAMQRLGLEWVHRLATEPRRLARRYLVEGLPFAAELMAHAHATRARR